MKLRKKNTEWNIKYIYEAASNEYKNQSKKTPMLKQISNKLVQTNKNNTDHSNEQKNT